MKTSNFPHQPRGYAGHQGHNHIRHKAYIMITVLCPKILNNAGGTLDDTDYKTEQAEIEKAYGSIP